MRARCPPGSSCINQTGFHQMEKEQKMKVHCLCFAAEMINKLLTEPIYMRNVI